VTGIARRSTRSEIRYRSDHWRFSGRHCSDCNSSGEQWRRFSATRWPWALGLLFLLVFAAERANAQTKTVLYTAHDSVVVNPERGIVPRGARDPIGGSGQGSWVIDAVQARWTTKQLRAVRNSVWAMSMINAYVDLRPYVNTSVLPQSFLDKIHADLDSARAAGVKVILVHSYDVNGVDGVDAELPVMIGHMQQLRDVYYHNADVIAFMEIGFIGRWGEMHSSSHGYDTNPAAYRQIVDAVATMLPPSRMIGVRVPWKHAKYYYGTPDTAVVDFSTAWNGSLRSRIGWYNDAMLTNDGDGGTFDGECRTYDATNGVCNDTAIWRPWTARFSKYTWAGGETSQIALESDTTSPAFNYRARRWVRTFCQDTVHAIGDLYRFHYSYMNKDWNGPMWPNSTDIAQNISKGTYRGQTLAYWYRRILGYRFELVNAVLSASAAPGGTFRLRFTVRNSGTSSPQNPRGLEFVLKGPVERKINLYRFKTTCDPRTWSGSNAITTVDTTFTLPADLPAGTYTPYLSLPDTCRSIYSRPEFAIRFANENVWEPATGYNNLLASIVIQP
jgi:Domain of unknown function (DUF4832)/Domain of unknown function (DUF4874)